MRPIIPHTYKIEVIQTYEGVPFANVFHWFDSNDPNAGTLATAAQHGWETTNGPADFQRDSFLYDKTVVTNFNSTDDPLEMDWDPALAGHGHVTTGLVMPLSDCSVTTLLTGGHGRRGRGRLYISGHTDGMYDQVGMKWNVFTHAGLTGMIQAMNQYMSSNTGGGTMCVLSRLGSGTPEAPIPQAYVISGFRFNVGIGSQRRRDRRMAKA